MTKSDEVVLEEQSGGGAGLEPRQPEDRRCGMDRRSLQLPYDGPDRRVSTDEDSSWDRRRGPGRRRSDDRRSAEEGEMSDDQFEYIKAIEEYKKVNHRPFPSFTEILEIVKALGYRKVAEPVSITTLKRQEV